MKNFEIGESPRIYDKTNVMSNCKYLYFTNKIDMRCCVTFYSQNTFGSREMQVDFGDGYSTDITEFPINGKFIFIDEWNGVK